MRVLNLRLLIIAMLFVLLAAAPLMTWAQEGEAEQTTEETAAEQTTAEDAESGNQFAADGMGTLMLLVGVGAIFLVGGTMIARDNFRGSRPAR